MITTVSTAAALNTALKAAHAGDTILLSAGTYSGISTSNLHFAQDVTVTSAVPGSPATLTSLKVIGSSGLTFRDLDFRVDAAAGDNPFQISKSQDVTLTGLNVHGSLDGNPQNDRAAMLVRDSSNVTVADSKFQQLWLGIGHLNNDHLTIEGNTFKDIRMDGVRGGGSSNVTISGNSFSDFHPVTGDHPDAIQFWTSGTTASAHDITISDNVFLRGAGTGTIPQGIFFNDEVGTLPYQRVTITGNLVAGGGYNSIAVYHGEDVAVKDNIVVAFTGEKSWIHFERVDGGTVSGNTATTLNLPPTNANVTVVKNTIVAPVSDGGAAYLKQWQGGQAAPVDSSFFGTAGADTLSGSVGGDILSGGLGDDTYVVNHGGDSVVEAAGAGNDLVQSTVSHTLGANVERLTLTGAASVNGYGNELANTLSGNGAANLLSGGGANDTLTGGAGNDTIQAGDGADKLTGGLGVDRLEGGAGDDYYVVDDARDQSVETIAGAAGGKDLVASSVSYSLGANLENLTLGAGAIDGAGNALGNSIKGGAGANKLSGLAGADTLSGMDGNDTLIGGAGADLLGGGPGADRFVFTKGEAAGDCIQDFAAADHIDLLGYSSGSTIAAAAGSTTSWIVKDAATGATETIQLLNAYKLTASDFLFA
jgi:Ca2+-binding RTX toxin-like protein